jgi:hypothetical protein
MKANGARRLLEWVLRENYDGRYAFWLGLLRSIDNGSWFWPRYEELYSKVAVHKQVLTHYLFTAAVQFLLAREQEAPMARHFPAYPPTDKGVTGTPPVSTFLDFCVQNWQSIEDIVQTREVQINKLGRNALILPLLSEAHKRAGGAATYVEVGSSVGLGLLWPWLAARYSTGSLIDGCLSEGEAVCNCRVIGEPTLPLSGSSPRPARLVGIEVDPLSVDNRDDLAWLRALVASNDDFGRRELERGLALLRRHRPEILAGCVLDRLGDVVADMPEDQPLVVYHCMTLHHLVEAGKLEAWRTMLRAVAEARPVIEAYVAWEECEPTASPWPVEVRIREWHRDEDASEFIGWTDPSADGILLQFRSTAAE